MWATLMWTGREFASCLFDFYFFFALNLPQLVGESFLEVSDPYFTHWKYSVVASFKKKKKNLSTVTAQMKWKLLHQHNIWVCQQILPNV